MDASRVIEILQEYAVDSRCMSAVNEGTCEDCSKCTAVEFKEAIKYAVESINMRKEEVTENG